MPRAPRRHADEPLLRALALAFPEAHEDFPWGHRAIKVRGKAFVFMSKDEPALSVSVKLPWSAEGALQLPCCEPTHYGLGRSGWVTATFGPKEKAPLDALGSWIEESYRAVAPKRLVAQLAPRTAAAPPGTRAAARARRGATARDASGKPRPRSRRRS